MSTENKYGIYIGTPSENIQATGAIILAILSSTSEEKTKREALRTFSAVSKSPMNSSISGCSVSMESPEK